MSSQDFVDNIREDMTSSLLTKKEEEKKKKKERKKRCKALIEKIISTDWLFVLLV